MANLVESQRLFEKALTLMPGGVNSPVRGWGAVGLTPPPLIVRGAGSRVYDVDGNSYLDFVGSWGPLILGHAVPAVVAAVQEAASRGLSFGASTPGEVELAQLLVEAVPSLEMVRLVTSGTEACMSALRLARGATGRARVIKFDGCYHGHADSFLVAAGSGVLTQAIPGSPGVPAEIAALTLSLPYNDLEAVQEAVQRHAGEIAAIIVEPVAGNMGVVLPREGFSGRLAAVVPPGRHHLNLRRGDFRLPGGLGRGPGPLRGQTRPHLPGQDHRRRAAGGGLRRPAGADVPGGAGRPHLPGGDPVRQPGGGGRGAGHPEGPATGRDL